MQRLTNEFLSSSLFGVGMGISFITQRIYWILICIGFCDSSFGSVTLAIPFFIEAVHFDTSAPLGKGHFWWYLYSSLSPSTVRIDCWMVNLASFLSIPGIFNVNL